MLLDELMRVFRQVEQLGLANLAIHHVILDQFPIPLLYTTHPRLGPAAVDAKQFRRSHGRCRYTPGNKALQCVKNGKIRTIPVSPDQSGLGTLLSDLCFTLPFLPCQQ